jgi:hypothetical protein
MPIKTLLHQTLRYISLKNYVWFTVFSGYFNNNIFPIMGQVNLKKDYWFFIICSTHQDIPVNVSLKAHDMNGLICFDERPFFDMPGSGLADP